MRLSGVIFHLSEVMIFVQKEILQLNGDISPKISGTRDKPTTDGMMNLPSHCHF